MKQLQANILRLEEKLAKYLKIEEEFEAIATQSKSQPEKFELLITKYNDTKV
jgi:thermostable 8-oxoguanine DNA glycosylase